MQERQTALSGYYRRKGISLTQYRGWALPSSYRAAEEEFRTLTRGAGLMETPFSALLEVSGNDRMDLLHRISTNDLSGMSGGTVRGTLFLTDKAKLIDLAFCAAEDQSLTVVLSGERESEVRQMIERYTILEDVRVRAISGERAVISALGPGSLDFGRQLTGRPVLPGSCFRHAFEFGTALVVAVRTSRWQLFHLIVERHSAGRAWEWLLGEGAHSGVRPVGALGFDLYRVTAGMPMAGAEIGPEHNPYDAGLLEFVSFTKGCYIGQEVVARIDTYGKQKRTLAGCLLDNSPGERSLPLRLTHRGNEAGILTSVAAAPISGHYPALGVLPVELAAGGAELMTEGFEPRISARVHTLPVVME